MSVTVDLDTSMNVAKSLAVSVGVAVSLSVIVSLSVAVAVIAVVAVTVAVSLVALSLVMRVAAARRICRRDSANLSPAMTLEDGREWPSGHQNSNSIIWRSTTIYFGYRVNPINAKRSCYVSL